MATARIGPTVPQVIGNGAPYRGQQWQHTAPARLAPSDADRGVPPVDVIYLESNDLTDAHSEMSLATSHGIVPATDWRGTIKRGKEGSELMIAHYPG